MSNAKMYAIPLKFRRTENLHILFWLMKDISWAMLWRPIGIGMLVPTLFVAIWITLQTRHLKAELYHNLAITFWICANGFWMIVEFFGYDEQLRIFTAIPFGIGLFFILTYYLFIFPKERKAEKLLAAKVELPEKK